ncbi:GGDEF domain-containing protein, diguanylate cyclase (c-di-GMP synthetase) or its enzymatically inactive variants [Desulfacinum hydrothermale DSM 13146]|uniref:GGDEF domain-containing protein, diguanylate cyclase (C-di-GMP synthetase) or its enzymatically inactive variants n=1 Tax=Desulfacinum hydrothermale DSM 13146 TaxID=1121390 RepID=A0A1W1XK48_9BACT|nr:diguanylate cyclase [Desulfacinum hydrothermale]SMC24144.1 GGDEF domain-containing protein, diguanylate cyclase (c-di-GMP synthetase) or its enzymatically inactive variants [Desulfacinum hydrothermale DSM 13146]
MNTFESVIHLLSNVLDAYTVAFFQYDPHCGAFRLVAAHSLSKYLQTEVSIPKDGSGILSQVHKVGHTVHLGKVDVDKLAASLPFYREGEGGIKGLLATPVGTGQGLLYADTKRHWGFNDKQQKWILETARVLRQLLDQQQCVFERNSYSRILTLWHELIECWHTAKDPLEAAHELTEKARAFLGTDWAFCLQQDPGERDGTMLSASGSLPRGLLQRPLPVSSPALVAETMRKGGQLFIPALKPDADEHYLFFPGENLPHQGSLWVLTTERRAGGRLCLAVLARKKMSWAQDERYAVEKALQIFAAFLDSVYWHARYLESACTHGPTGLLNECTLAQRLHQCVQAAIHGSTPLALIVVQCEPWQYAQSIFPPSETNQWESALAAALRDATPPGAIAGRLAQNRYAVLHPQGDMKELMLTADALDACLIKLSAPRRKGIHLKIHLGWASLPQDGTTADDLWQTAYRRLLESFRPGPSRSSPSSGSS